MTLSDCLPLYHSNYSYSYPFSTALLFSFFVIVFVAVISIVTRLSNDLNVLLVNAAFLFLIILGGLSSFGFDIVRVLRPYAQGVLLKLKGRQKVFLEAPEKIDRKTSFNTFLSVPEEQASGNEIVMLEILCKAQDAVEKEKVCHKQICHWRAMLALLTEDMIDGNGVYAGHSANKATTPVEPILI